MATGAKRRAELQVSLEAICEYRLVESCGDGVQAGDDLSSIYASDLYRLTDTIKILRCVHEYKIAALKTIEGPGALHGEVGHGRDPGVKAHAARRMNVTIMQILHRTGVRKLGAGVGSVAKEADEVAQSFCPPLPVDPRQAGFAGEELLHGGLLDRPLLGDQRIQRPEQPIDIRQRLGDGALLDERGYWE